jgi:hypothetical protein
MDTGKYKITSQKGAFSKLSGIRNENKDYFIIGRKGLVLIIKE